MKFQNVWITGLVITATLNTLKSQSFFATYTPALTSFTATGQKSREHLLGHQIDIGAFWVRSTRLSIWAGLGYSFQQSEYDYTIAFSGEQLQTWFRHQDLTLPVQLRYGFQSSPNRFYASLGLVPGFRLSRKVLETRSSYPNLPRDVTSDQDYDPFELSVTGGIGYSFTLKNRSKGFVQPSFRSNLPTQFYYLLRYLFGRKNDTNDDPPGWNTAGITLGFAWQ
ncbi:MAG TPA: outer membrane beta-barrel protein [Saprospiraceae bacterium]|nr:outer membrane beta-barrel protein [Saprospiraceae bacterium]